MEDSPHLQLEAEKEFSKYKGVYLVAPDMDGEQVRATMGAGAEGSSS